MGGQQVKDSSASAAQFDDSGIRTDKTGLDRIVFFSDAVIAIAITLLVLDIRLPDDLKLENSSQMWSEVAALRWQILAFVISFLVIGSFWAGHMRRFRSTIAYDGRLIWLNLFLLMAVAFVPFPTAVLSEYGDTGATIFYAITISIMGLLALANWVYASRDHRLIDPLTPASVIRRETLRISATPIVFLASIPVAMLNADLGKYFWMLLIPASLLIRKVK